MLLFSRIEIKKKKNNINFPSFVVYQRVKSALDKYENIYNNFENPLADLAFTTYFFNNRAHK